MLTKNDQDRIKYDRAVEAASKGIHALLKNKPKLGHAVRHLRTALGILQAKTDPIKECTGCGRCVACVVASLEKQVALLTAERNDLRDALRKERSQRLEDV